MDTKITDLTDLGALPADGDVFVVVDISDTSMSGAGTDKQVSYANLTAGLATAGANSDITSLSGLTTPLSVAQGGTSATTLTGILLGNGTSAVTALSSTGTGDVVRATSPTLVTPNLGTPSTLIGTNITGTASALSIGGNAATATAVTSFTPAGGSLTLSGADAITLSTANTTTLTLPTTGTLATLAGTETLTDKRITPRVGTVADAATITPTADTSDMYTVTALAQAATIAAPSGTPTNGQKLIIRLLDNGTARALTWDGIYAVIGTILPTTTVLGKYTYVGCIYNSASTKWDVLAVQTQV